MKYLLTTVILVAGILGCATTQYKQAELPEVAWRDMCALLETEAVFYQCMRVMPPLVEYEKMRDGLSGYYEGGDTVFINKNLSQEDQLRTLIHEQIHYLHVQLQMIVVPGYPEPICWSENEAWTLEGIYSGKDNSKWWIAYPYCWEFYADDTNMQELGALLNAITEIMDDYINETPGE
jgi:hypothetical protein